MKNQNHYHIVAKAISYICNHYIEQPDLEQIAHSVNMSKFHFQRLFKEWAGITPKAFLQYTTIEHAKKSLIRGNSTLEASLASGLSGNSRLHDLFVKIEACTPGDFKQRCRGLTLQISELDSPFGKIAVAETDRGISNMIFGEVAEIMEMEQYKNAQFCKGLGENGQLINEYFSNWERPLTKIRLDLSGTPFQIQVWKALLNIPSSQTASYKSVAKFIRKPRSARAVGSAIAKNPVAYFIPCHRIIKSTGGLGNYHWGSERKLIINAYEASVL